MGSRSELSIRRGLRVLRSGLLLSMAIVAAQAANGDARVYRWTDSQGHVHYGDVPADPNAAAFSPRTSTASESVAPTVNQAECDRRKEQFESYRNAGSIKETNSLGEVREYSEAERKKLIARTEAAMHEACGDQPTVP